MIAVSGVHNQGLDSLWQKIDEHRVMFENNGVLRARRCEQMRRWMWSMVDDRLLRAVRRHPAVAAQTAQLEAAVLDGKLTATLGAEAILKAFESWSRRWNSKMPARALQGSVLHPTPAPSLERTRSPPEARPVAR